MNNLKKLRTDKGLSQLELSHKSNIALSVISKIESGYSDIMQTRVCTVAALAKALDCTIERLYEEEKEHMLFTMLKNGEIIKWSKWSGKTYESGEPKEWNIPLTGWGYTSYNQETDEGEGFFFKEGEIQYKFEDILEYDEKIEDYTINRHTYNMKESCL